MDTADITRAEALLPSLPPAGQAELSRAIKLMRQALNQSAHEKRITSAYSKLIDFAQVTMPQVNTRSGLFEYRYKPVRHHRALAAALEEVEAGRWKNLIITMPPRHGKSELAVKRMAAWFIGRDPYRQVMFGTYSDELAGDTGREIREIFRSPEYLSIFPGFELRKGSQSADRINTKQGGGVLLAGRGGAFNGRGADLAIVDDPLKGRQEAESKATRKEVWSWFNDDLRTRLLSDSGRIIIIMTRWHEDDLIGRLIDPKNDEYSVEEAANWRILDLPALAYDEDPLGRAPGEALWPERFGRPYLEAIRARNPRGFASLYQCRPTPDDGDFFKADWLVPYKSVGELPKNLRWYGASDHAVGTRQVNDKTCLGCGGVDEDGVLWIPPDIDWGRFETDQTVDRMIAQIKLHKPLTWFAEQEHISKSIGPFLRKRMRDESAYAVIEASSSNKDNQSRAQSVRGMMAMGMVRFPVFASWWADAQDELLKFPNAGHDDFVSFLSHLGRGVDRMTVAQHQKAPEETVKRGTLNWFKQIASRGDVRPADRRKGW